MKTSRFQGAGVPVHGSPAFIRALGRSRRGSPRGPSDYNALQLSLEKAHELRPVLPGARTSWGKSLDVKARAGTPLTGGESRINIQNPADLRADYGLSNFDIRQRFTLSTVYQVPFGHGRQFLSNANRVVDAIAGGWQISSILTLQGGMPFSISMATATDNTGTFQRPNRVCDGNLPSGQQSIKDWYNLTCFVAPPIYTFGNTGRNVLIGPKLETWDLGTNKATLRINEPSRSSVPRGVFQRPESREFPGYRMRAAAPLPREHHHHCDHQCAAGAIRATLAFLGWVFTGTRFSESPP